MKICASSRFCRVLACVLLISFVTQIVYPLAAYGLTGGPSQPEFSSFESVSTAEMVNAFTGDFTYNLPLLTVPGPQGSSYPISLSYHSGSSPEEEASWVGYGWSLSPGQISRTQRGLPDDDKGEAITYYNKMPANWTVSADAGVSGELFSIEGVGAATNASVGLRYNNYSGFGWNASLGIGPELFSGNTNVNFGLSVSESGNSYSMNVSPYKNLAGTVSLSVHDSPDGVTFASSYNPFTFLEEMKAKKRNEASYHSQAIQPISLVGGNHSLFSFSEMVRPMSVTPYKGTSVDVKVGFEGNPLPLPAGVEGRISGTYSVQKMTEERISKSYGYMYAAAGSEQGQSNDEGIVQDYYTEKETAYNKRDKFLGMSFNNADNFTVSGEGVGGGFRLYHKQIGQFIPTYAQSSILMVNAGADIHVGTAWGTGGSLDAGSQTMTEQSWDAGLTSWLPSTTTDDEPCFFRFNNDLAGNLTYGMNSDAPASALLRFTGEDVAVRMPILRPAQPVSLPKSLTSRAPRSSVVSYSTNRQMLQNGSPSARAYNRRTDVNTLARRSNGAYAEKLGELVVHTTAGMEYVYALPVYNKNEKHIQLGAKAKRRNLTTNNGYLLYGVSETNNPIKVGEERKGAYANIFLLTQITTPDYADLKFDGPTADDAGGYTLFSYSKLYGDGSEKNAWYHWRMPYSGVLYQKGTVSDPMDDRGSFSEGDKEVYLLKKIETKTHVAIFRTSEERTDALDAASGEDAMQSNAKGNRRLKQLNRIDLYTQADYAKLNQGDNSIRPIKSVFFKYNHSLCKGLPNSSTTDVAANGKLTLEKVWFEYYGVTTNGKISPYIFEYQYPDYSTYPTQYPLLDDEYQFSAADQNPNFSHFQMDAWGNYQYKGEERFRNLLIGVNQTPDRVHFDPAAWQLKVIKLPSGGEIHVQYEQDDYAFVQDQPAQVLRQLDPSSSDARVRQLNGLGQDVRQFFIRPQEGESAQELHDAIDAYYVKTGRKMYFRFLYRLLGAGDIVPGPDDCNAEFISGYMTVSYVGIEGSGENARVFVRLGGYTAQLGVGSVGVRTKTTDYELPTQACEDFVKTQRVGKLNTSGSCGGVGAIDQANGESAVESAANDAVGMVEKLLNSARVKIGVELCWKVNPAYSFLKIPSVHAKRGGGLRVKRLLTFDKGMNGETVLYGSEYEYTLRDKNNRLISSGVATNEPSPIREENPLIGLLPRDTQSFGSKVVAGIDKKQAEGPLGESLLPGASVGYARVIIKNIHSGKTNPGFSVQEFYTANQPVEGASNGQTYAFRAEQSELQSIQANNGQNIGLVSSYVNKAWLAQGFSFFINDMHGKPKRTATYAGKYSDLAVYDLEKAAKITEQVYEYYAPGENVPVVEPSTGTILPDRLGREVDVSYGQKKIQEERIEAGAVGDVVIGFFGLITIPTFVLLPTGHLIQNESYVHTTTKVIRETCMLKRVRSYADGIYHTEEYMAFDKATGQPVWSKYYDEFSERSTAQPLPASRMRGGTYATQTILASWKYPGMGAKYLNEGLVVQSPGSTIVAEAGKEYLRLASGDVTQACASLQKFAPGDLIEVIPNQLYYHVGEADYLSGRIQVYRISELGTGTPPPSFDRVTIVRSGRSNELTIPAGATTYHNKQGIDKLPQVVAGNLVDAENFSADLTARYQSISSGAATQGTFTLNNNRSTDQAYDHMNISAYGSKIPASCTGKLNDASIKNIQFRYSRKNGKIALQLISFDVVCEGSGTHLVHNE